MPFTRGAGDSFKSQENRVNHLHVFLIFLFRHDGGGNNAAGLATPAISVASATATATADGSVSVLGSPIRFEPPELDFQQQ